MIAICVVGAVLVLAAQPGHANWLTKLLKEAGEAGQTSGRLGGGALGAAARQLAKLPPLPGRGLLAATVSGEGHWTFVNRAGQRFTAGTPEEMTRVGAMLLADAPPRRGITVVVADDLLFTHRAQFKDLPADMTLRLAARDETWAVRGAFRDPTAPLFVDVRPNVQLRLTSKVELDEGLWQLGRPVKARGVRVLALDASGPAALPSTGRIDRVSKQLEADRIKPAALARALGALRNQTVVISARIEGGSLIYRGAAGGERVLPLKDIIAAAERADINLVLVNARAPRQPGDRNWLWQRVTIDGLEDAIGAASKADFLSSLAGDDGRMVLRVAKRGGRRAVILAEAQAAVLSLPVSGQFGWLMAEVVSEVAGTVVANGVRLDLISRERQKELDERIVPGIPADVQFFVIGLWTMGLLSLRVLLGWWGRMWPPEKSKDYAGPVGYGLARAARWLLFALVFMPLAGFPGLLWLAASTLWAFFAWPFRRGTPNA